MSDFDDFLAALRKRLRGYLAGERHDERLGDLCYETGLLRQDVEEFLDGAVDRYVVEKLAEYLWPDAAV